jgi:hypothetical protein
LCAIDDAKLLLSRAKLFYPVAASGIEEGIRLVREPIFRPSQIEYRKPLWEMRGTSALTAWNGRQPISYRPTTFLTILRPVTSVLKLD